MAVQVAGSGAECEAVGQYGSDRRKRVRAEYSRGRGGESPGDRSEGEARVQPRDAPHRDIVGEKRVHSRSCTIVGGIPG